MDDYKVLRYRWKYYAFIQMIIVLVICLAENFWLKNRINTCVMDGVGLIMNGALFLILYIINIFYTINVINSRNDIQVILRYGSRKRHWKEDMLQIIIINAITSVLWCLAGLFSGVLYSKQFYNWMEFDSFFSQETTSTGNSVCGINAIMIVFIAFIVIMLLLDVISIFMSLSTLITDNIYAGTIIILGSGFLDTWILKEPIFLKRFLIYADIWLNIDMIIKNIVLLAVLLISMIIIGQFIIEGKLPVYFK